LKKYTISQTRFLNWYMQSNEMKLQFAELIIRALNKQGICRVSIKKIFDSTTGTIPSYIVPGYNIDEPETELTPNENIFLELWKD
jgi:hypothetical protein